jgi:hypothetical protein
MTTKKNIPYLERLRSELERSISSQEERTRALAWGKVRLVVAAGATLLAAGAVSAIVLTGAPSRDVPGRVDGSGPGTGMGRCVEEFSVESLAGRDFAFDGTISHVDPRGDAGGDAGAVPTEVTFQVHHWYKGGSGDEVVLKTYEQPGVVTSVEGSPALSAGTRLLASGDDLFLWSCGFSMPYTEANARLFVKAFAE